MQNKATDFFSVKKISFEDIPSVFQLTSNLDFLNWSLKQFEKELEYPFTFALVAKDKKEETIGYALFHLLSGESELLAIGVKKEFQKLSVGTALLNECISYLKASGIQKIFLEVREHNISARHFYEKFLFKNIGLRKSYYTNGENAILYQKNINEESDA